MSSLVLALMRFCTCFCSCGVNLFILSVNEGIIAVLVRHVWIVVDYMNSPKLCVASMATCEL